MWSVHKKLGELWFKHSIGDGWTEQEEEDFKLALDANMRKCQKIADLHNLSLIASMIDDTEWQHELCAQLDKLKEEMFI